MVFVHDDPLRDLVPAAADVLLDGRPTGSIAIVSVH
jgi:hypothetical protein